MRKALVVIAVALLSATSAYAQDSAKEADIRAQLPYVSMCTTIPGLTLDQYNAVVRELANVYFHAPAVSAVVRTPAHRNPSSQLPAANRFATRTPPMVNPHANPFSLTGTTNPFSPGAPVAMGTVTNPFANIPGLGSHAPAPPVMPFVPSVPLTR